MYFKNLGSHLNESQANSNLNELKKIGLANINTNYHAYLKKSNDAEKSRTNMYAGAFLIIDHHVLLIRDNQDGNKKFARTKVPGGVAENVETQELFLIALQVELRKMKFGNGLLNQIMTVESNTIRTHAERTMILEMIEETGYYPVKWGYICDGYRFNRNEPKENKIKHTLWQVYFEVFSVVSSNSKSLEEPIKRITQMRTTTAIDVDVTNMRLVVPIEKLLFTLQTSTARMPVQDAAIILLSKQAEFYRKKGLDNLSREYAMACCE